MVKKQLEVNPDIDKLASRIISEQHLDVRPAKIVYLTVYPNITKTTIAKCIKASNELAFFSDADYLIEVSGEVWDALDDDSRYVLLYHELLHVMPIMDEKTGNFNMQIRDHDVIDFRQVLNKYGMDWDKKIKAIVSSIYQMDPAEEDKIKYS